MNNFHTFNDVQENKDSKQEFECVLVWWGEENRVKKGKNNASN